MADACSRSARRCAGPGIRSPLSTRWSCSTHRSAGCRWRSCEPARRLPRREPGVVSEPGSVMAHGSRHARVAVVGAGAAGLAVALQLRRAGVDDVVVIDRNASAGMGSTSRANGGVRAQFTTAINIAFSQFTIERLRELHEQTGGLVGFKPVGYLFLTGTDTGEIALRRAWEDRKSTR